ncbi:UbiA family prenyltransferase [Sorangium sp. So ce1078]|uniref:UbiA family prenyltransferase n=1 Tax=Sorangium sp. So ce1078 TaxID=3133329 RepID=UPI003F61AB85
MQKSVLAEVDLAHQAVLAVDADSTLVKTNVSVEALISLIKCNLVYAIVWPLWVLWGRASFWREVERRASLEVASLPYDEQLLAYLVQQHRLGREIALTTSADIRIGRAIAAHLGVFTQVISSAGDRSENGARRCLHEALGGRPFVYLARRHGGPHLHDIMEESPRLHRVLPRALRSHQWAKNALLFVPLLTSHRLLDLVLLAQVVCAFASFSLCASSTYLLNDMFDLEADRRHPSKRHRPLASGALPLGIAVWTCTGCLAAGLGLSLLLPGSFQAILVLYYALTVAYSMYLKRKLLIDVHLLAGLYTIRVLAGSAATGLPASSWLLAFCMFLFLSLAMLKRFIEVRDLAAKDIQVVAGRGYLSCDADAIRSLGTSSGLLSVAILSLYINSPQVVSLYETPMLLWLLCPLLVYCVSRLWILAHRREIHADPVVFALKDRACYLVGLSAGAVLLLATMRIGG